MVQTNQEEGGTGTLTGYTTPLRTRRPICDPRDSNTFYRLSGTAIYAVHTPTDDEDPSYIPQEG